jgi:hypothetical protein
MANSIIGDSFDRYVKEQILVRQSILGLGPKDQDAVIYKNNNSAFVRLTSGVNVDANIVKGLGLTGTGYEGNGLAKQFKLFSARTQNGNTETFTNGIGYDNLSSYGFLSNSDYGYVPPPGIVSAEVKAMNRGSLREANIEIQCHNLQQFQILEILYMRLKYSVLLEWGHNMYYSNPTRGNSQGITQEPQLIQSRFDLSDEILDGNQTQETILNLISDTRRNSSGNYDAFFGLVTNFSWTLRPDGGYNITVTARSTGDVIESLKINSTHPSKNDPPLAGKLYIPLANSGVANTALQTDFWKSSLHKLLTIIATKLYGKNYSHGIDEGEEGLYDPIHNYKLEEYSDLKAAFNRTTLSGTKSKKEQDFLTYQEALQIEFPNLSGGMFGKSQYYMKLGTLLRIIESFLLYYDTSKDEKRGRPPLFKIDYNYNDNYCLTFPRHISLNPKVCLIPLDEGTVASTNDIDIAVDTTYTFYTYRKLEYDVNTKQDYFYPTYSWDQYQKEKNNYPDGPNVPWRGEISPIEVERGTFTNITPYTVQDEATFFSDLGNLFQKDANTAFDFIQEMGNIVYFQTQTVPNTQQALNKFKNRISSIRPSTSPTLNQSYVINVGPTPNIGGKNNQGDAIQRVGFVKEWLLQTIDGGDKEIWLQQYEQTITIRQYRNSGVNIAPPTEGGAINPATFTYTATLKQNPFRAGGFKGRMMHMMVNMEYVAQTLNDNINVEKGEIALYDFLDNLMKGIQHALGNVNNFEIIYDEDNNTHRIIDNTTIPGVADVSQGIVEFNANILQPSRALFPDGKDNGKIGGSFIKSVNFKTKLSNNFATMTTIGAQKNGNAVGSNSTMLSKWNNGLTDRIITERANPNYNKTDDAEKIEESYYINVVNLQNFNSLVDERKVGDFEIKATEGTMTDLFQAELGKFIEKDELPGIGFIPFDLELTMLGLSGPRIYEAYTIDTTLLPNSYKDKIQFICTGVSHRISDGEWATTLNSIVGPKQSTKIFNPPPVKVLKDAAPEANGGGNDDVAILPGNYSTSNDNNPFNLRPNSGAQFNGVIGKKEGFRGSTSIGFFVVFDNIDNGVRAGLKNLEGYFTRRNLKTISEIINTYAPAEDGNETTRYIADVVSWLNDNWKTGTTKDTILSFAGASETNPDNIKMFRELNKIILKKEGRLTDNLILLIDNFDISKLA